MSGGADSTALLLGLCRVAPEFGLEIAAAHLHHGLRGAEAGADLAFVRRLCDELGVPLSSARWNTRARMKRRGLSGQAGLRLLRREFLLAAARRANADAIATGHTADDQLETLLLRLGRGAGLRGLGAMSARRGRWIRPLLPASRDMIEADLRAAGIAWREDRSNADPRYTRSRIRHDAVPALLRALGAAPAHAAGARGALARRVARSLEEVRSARRLAERRAARLLSHASGPLALDRRPQTAVALDCTLLRREPGAVRSAAIRLAWARLGTGVGLTRRHLDALLGLLAARSGARSDLPRACAALRDGRLLRIRRVETSIQPLPASTARRFPVPGRRALGGHRVSGLWLPGGEARRRLESGAPGEEFFASGAIYGGLELRTARSDERFIPFGHRNPRRLGEFLKKQRVAPAARNRPVVLADRRGILWVLGVRRSARAPLTPATRKALWICSRPR